MKKYKKKNRKIENERYMRYYKCLNDNGITGNAKTNLYQ